MRKYTVTAGGKAHTLELEESEGVVRALVDGNARELTMLGGPPGTLTWLEGTRVVHAAVDKATVTVRGIAVPTEVADARAAVASAAAAARPQSAGPVSVRAPIPGRVARVLVKAGDEVTSGKALVVVEAMKMENEIRAPRAGKVAEVRCSEGAAVEAGQVLVVVSS